MRVVDQTMRHCFVLSMSFACPAITSIFGLVRVFLLPSEVNAGHDGVCNELSFASVCALVLVLFVPDEIKVLEIPLATTQQCDCVFAPSVIHFTLFNAKPFSFILSRLLVSRFVCVFVRG